MADPAIRSGDRVVDLGASLRFAALVAGAIACALSAWVVEKQVLWTLGGLILGGVGGFCIGLVIGPLVFRAGRGQVVVVKVGPGALMQTLRANLIGAVGAGLIAAVVPALMFAPSAHLGQFVGLGVGVGMVVGVGLGYIASRR
jgi:hypothetical protein